ncbi:Uncharacterized protein FWK35_00028686 [Aphis craccivora]|uniref:Double jelly roll-like domain-containing protein n=1 Tax=Aphis craccivora TaxID=307492 RepID=A0A6G0VX23_APHCR|nr:Uncharacterized protein FWK35_00028686 [Aphis craccivora]
MTDNYWIRAKPYHARSEPGIYVNIRYLLPRNTSHSWTIKSSSLLEKPRFILFGLQIDRKKI